MNLSRLRYHPESKLIVYEPKAGHDADDAELMDPLDKMRYYRKAREPQDTLGLMAKALKKLATYDPSRAKTERANMLPAAERGIDFAVVVEDVTRALGEWIELVTLGSAR